MITRRQALVGSITLGSFVVLAPSDARADAAREPLAIISSKQGGVTELSLYQLKRLYLGDAVQGPSGELMALNREVKGPERLGFDRTVLGMSSEAAARYWIDRRIRGQSGAPRAVEPATVIQRVVARVPRAVGYILPRDLSPDVQIVKIDGKKPGDAGYPIFTEHGKSAAVSLWSLLAEL
jgi:hypothetical protein